MSQSRVNEFFISRKGVRDSQPSKRRKLVDPDSITDASLSKRKAIDPEPVLKTISKEEPLSKDINFSSQSVSGDNDSFVELKKKPETAVPKSQTVTAKTKTKPNIRMNTRLRKKNELSKGQQKLKFGTKVDTKCNPTEQDFNDSDSNIETKDQQTDVTEDGDGKFVCSTKSEEVTSVWDDHANQEITPRKRIISESDSLSQGPKSRIKKSAARKLNQADSGSDSPATPVPVREVKKKLDLCLKREVAVEPKNTEDTAISTSTEESTTTTKVVDLVTPSKSDLLNIVSQMSDIEGAISPLAVTPEHLQHSPETSLAADPSTSTGSSSKANITITPRLQDLSQKLKALSKMDGKALKNRLKKKGLLGEVKEKLDDLSQANADNKKAEPKTVSVDTPETLPAYQRYDYLVKEGPPTLTLPYAYRLLESAFQAMDTVVSMLHNRAEVCTFDKLRTAVQNINKKNFYEKTVGQIRTVVPDAFVFKQERVPIYGQKASPYVLTIEANLFGEEGLNKCVNKAGKIPFTASVLLRRKGVFKAHLLKMVKKHHKVFLESLKPPLRIPDDKLSRWHPKFALDKVPEVDAASLPKSPIIQTVRTAKDILELQVGRINPRVEKALSKVVSESANFNNSKQLHKDQNNVAGNAALVKDSNQQPSSPSSSPSQSSLKGIPPALLAKIRAKEALKMEQKLTRNPVEETRIRMMDHLPEMIRILRSYFVTEKKPAILMENVIKKLKDSYHTGLSQGELEEHLKLLREMAPEFMSVVEIKRGKFVKLDKNVDVTVLSERITKKAKSQQ